MYSVYSNVSFRFIICFCHIRHETWQLKWSNYEANVLFISSPYTSLCSEFEFYSILHTNTLLLNYSHIQRTDAHCDLQPFARFFHILKMTNYYYHNFHMDILCRKWSTLMYTQRPAHTVGQRKRPQYIWRQGVGICIQWT